MTQALIIERLKSILEITENMSMDDSGELTEEEIYQDMIDAFRDGIENLIEDIDV